MRFLLQDNFIQLRNFEIIFGYFITNIDVVAFTRILTKCNIHVSVFSIYLIHFSKFTFRTSAPATNFGLFLFD